MSVLGIFDNNVAEVIPGKPDFRGSVTTSYTNTTYTRGAINITSFAASQHEPLLSADCIPWDHDSGADIIWLHFRMSTAVARVFPDMLFLCADDYTPIYSICNIGDGNDMRIRWYAWNDAGTVADDREIHYDGSGTTPEPVYWDIRIDRTNLTVKTYRNGNLSQTDTLVPSRTAGTQISKICLGRRVEPYFATVINQNFSEVILADEETIGWHLMQLGPNSSGSYSDEGGVYTTIDEAGYSTGDSNQLVGAGVNTFGYPDVVDLTQNRLEIVEVFIGSAANAVESAAAPTLTNQALIDGVLYDIGLGVDVTEVNYLTPVTGRTAVNPATGLAWTEQELNSTEFGYKTS